MTRFLKSAIGAVLVAVFLLAQLCAVGPSAAAATPECNGRAMYIAAHQDDPLLFQSPSLLQEIRSGRCVETVFLTTGDAGREMTYWHEREVGAEAAYAEMAGVADEWEASTTTVEGNALQTRTLKADPAVTLIFMRLPDGGLDGEGFARYGNQSLLKLWRSGNPGHGSPSITSITADDGSATYTYPQLVATLAALIDSYEPRLIATQNFNESLPEHLPGPDHPDHLVTAYMVRTAQEGYAAPHQLVAYKDYDTSTSPVNVTGTLLGAKQAAFFAYGAHDDETCVDEKSCYETSEYGNWLRRQYTTGKVTVGVVAHAGYLQEVTPESTVTLDGSRSSDQSGGSLAYEWTQTKGPAVTLNGGASAKPTFTAPGHPTLLRFKLVVIDGTTRSAPDEVTMRVPSADPTPVAAAGSVSTVASGASVELDGSASYDPNSEPLFYAWLQTAGPTVSLSGAATARPTFTAPTGPATLAFSLTVSNGVRVSEPANVTITVKGIAPSFTSAAATSFSTTEPGTFTVTTNGSPPPAISRMSGELPTGVTLTDEGDGTAVLTGTPPASDAPVGGSREYEFTLEASSVEGQVTQPFVLTVVNPVRAPLFTSATETAAKVGEASSFTVAADGEPDPALTIGSGSLPAGLTFVDTGDGTARITGMPAASAAPVGGSAAYPVGLVASNLAGSAEQTLTITVVGVPPVISPSLDPTPTVPGQPIAPIPAPKLSQGSVTLRVGRAARRVIKVTAAPGSKISCRGKLPPGAWCRVQKSGRVVVETRPTLSRAGRFPLTVRVVGPAGTVARSLVVRIVASQGI